MNPVKASYLRVTGIAFLLLLVHSSAGLVDLWMYPPILGELNNLALIITGIVVATILTLAAYAFLERCSYSGLAKIGLLGLSGFFAFIIGVSIGYSEAGIDWLMYRIMWMMQFWTFPGAVISFGGSFMTGVVTFR